MERLQGPLNSYFFGEHLEVNCLDKTERLKLEEEDERFVISSLEDNIPFLQMLQSVESPQFFPFNEPSFQTLVRLQHLKNPWEKGIPYIPKLETQSQALEFESCVTRDIVEMQSPLKSESYDLQHPHSSASCVEKVGYECNQEAPKSAEDCSKDAVGNSWHKDIIQCPKFQVGTRERRKRKRTRQTKNKEDVENQRMTHIAVERNRRRQMNEHLSVLKSLMPPSYIQRGDHASIIGGAIDFVKELEELLQSLEAQKRMKRNEEEGSCGLVKPSTPDYGMSSSTNCGAEVKVEKKLEAAAIEVTVNQKHVNLKIQCQKSRAGQLIKTIVGLEDLRLTVLHLSITSSDASVLYSFNLKIEEECKVGSANDIAEAIDQIFSFING